MLPRRGRGALNFTCSVRSGVGIRFSRGVGVERCPATWVKDVLRPDIYGISVRLIRNSAQASEVTQEVMLEIWNNAQGYRAGSGTIYAWASTIARRRAIDRIRSEEARTQREDRSFTVEREIPEIDDALMEQVDSQRVRHCLDTLTAKEKQTVLDTYYGGRTYAQVAEGREMPLATVKSRIRSALQRLKTCLEVA